MTCEGPVRRDGIGLKNVRERLSIQFGERASFEAAPVAGRWVAEIRLPLLADVIAGAQQEVAESEAQTAAHRSEQERAEPAAEQAAS